jgi:hypothetical protein
MCDDENSSPDPQPPLPAINASRVESSSDNQNPEVPYVSSKQELLAKIEALAGLGLSGLVPTPRVNAAHGCLRTVLQNLDDAETSAAGAIQDADALQLLRENPDALKLVKRFLTPDQLKLIIREAGND